MKENKYLVTPIIIEIRPSKMLPGEIGLFAARTLKKDTVIGDANLLGERFIPWSDFKRIDAITKRKIKQYCLQTPDGFYAPQDFNYLTVPWNMNHSCDYNVGFNEKGDFVTVKNVKRGDELVWDYGMGISDPKFKLLCKCGSKKCRKNITGNDWKDSVYREKNKKYFMRELLVEAQKHNTK